VNIDLCYQLEELDKEEVLFTIKLYDENARGLTLDEIKDWSIWYA
jgi:hypothetical protein